MIIYLNGDLFEELPPYSVIVHQTNCLGFAGAGIALQLALRYPNWKSDYQSYCKWFKDDRTLLLGTTHQYQVSDKLIICDAFGQDKISRAFLVTDYDAWDKILEKLEKQTRQIKTVSGKTWTLHMPYGIGCGLGGGDWQKMTELFEKWLKDSPVLLFIHKK